jgi:F-type H+-transporting ATPase subunit delta
MINHKVAHRYAVSLLESSIEKNMLDTVASDVESVYQSLRNSSELKRFLNNPVVRQELKISVVTEIFKAKTGGDLINFLKFVIEKGREDQLLNILEKFLSLKDEHLGIVNIHVNTAFEFSSEQSEKLKSRFESQLKKKVRLTFTIDKEIIGGFTAKVYDTVYDASVKHQLELLKKEFLAGGTSLN